MLDIQFIRDNADAVKKNANDRGMDVDIDLLLELDSQLRNHTKIVDDKRAERNENGDKLKSVEDKKSDEAKKVIAEGKSLKVEIADLEVEVEKVREEYNALMMDVPNMSHPETPLGKTDEDNKELSTWGDIPKIDNPLDHVELGKKNDLIDFERGAEVAGSGFYYLKNDAAMFELDMVNFGMKFCVENGFTPMLTPDMARKEIIVGAGFNPRSDEEKQIYDIEGEDLSLIGTSEITVGGYFAGHVFKKGELDEPKKIVALSHCFRTEAGAYGRTSKGLYRVHQFTKVEMFILSKPEHSDEMHDHLLDMEEKIIQHIGLPYRVVDVCTGDMGAPAYRKYDIEAWMPFKNGYGEITSASNCTDFQARRLNIKYVTEDGKKEYIHTLNGTAVVGSRMPLAVMENNQQPNGTVQYPIL